MKLAPQPVRCILDADHTPRHQLSPFLSIDCRLFVFSFCTPPFVFNSLQPLFRKHPGWGYLHKSSLWNQQLPASFFRPCLQDSYPVCQSCLLSASRRLRGNRFIAPLFSYSYESLFPQTLSFHIHTKPPGVWGATFAIPAWRLFGCHLLRLSKGFTARGPQAKAYFFSAAFTRSMMSTPPAAAMPRMLRSLVRCSRSSGNFIQSSTYMLSSSEHKMTAITPTKTRNVRNMGATASAAKLRPSYAGLLRNTSGKRKAHSYAALAAGWARRRRLTTRSRPRTTMVSKSGGATAWPTMATRVALMSRPALTPSASASARSAWSQASWLQSAGGIAASASASLASSSGTLGSFQNLALAAAPISNSSEKNARDQVEKSGSRRMRGRNKSTVLENHSRPAPLAHSSFHRPLRFSSAATSGSKSSIG